MRSSFLLPFLAFCLLTLPLAAQTGCPGCVVMLPDTLPDDTLFLPPLPPGEVDLPYDEDISFRMPTTTTPVNAVDSTTPPGLPISKIEIVAVEGLPAGLSWEPNQWVFETAQETDGCIRLCGTPLEADTFILTVRLKATVFFVVQETEFPMRLYIAPSSNTANGFSMTNSIGCDSTTVEFINNNPSGGQSGFTYHWDFGDSTTFDGENPPPHTYTAPGYYVVNYHAIIDTFGYNLADITVLEVDCVDQLGIGSADLFLQIKGPNGDILFDSSPDIDNTQLPHVFPVGLPMDLTANYTLEVWDEDTGLKGSDDLCGTISFNYLSNDTLVSGGLTVVLNVEHPVNEVESTDTVTVYASPAPPTITAPNGLATCAGSDSSIVLASSYGAGNQWFLDGAPIPGATGFVYETTVSGNYQVQITSGEGCAAISDTAVVTYHALPAPPVFTNTNNLLVLNPAVPLPPAYALQWLRFNVPIPGADSSVYCATQNGIYALQITDLATGCSSTFAMGVTYDPAFNCTVGTEAPLAASFRLFPNPATDQVTLQLEEPLSSGVRLRVWDATGRRIRTVDTSLEAGELRLDCSDLPAGWFTVELFLQDGQRYAGRLVKF
jgi:hypothetical protein